MRAVCRWRGDVMTTAKQEGLARLRAAYPEWTFEEDGETISAKLDGKHIALWLRIAWKAKVVAWPGCEKLHPALASYVFSSPDEVRCMMRALEGAAWAAANFHPGGFMAEERAPSPPAPVVDEAPDAEDAPDDELAAALVEVLSADLAKVKAERDEAQVKVAALRAELDKVTEARDMAVYLMTRRQGEYDQMRADRDRVWAERDALARAEMTRWQAELAAWQARELPCDDADEQRWRLYAGVQEEMGEVARCLLKGAQDIRGGAAVWRAQLPGEIGDVLVYLTQLATSCGVDLGAAYAEARAKVLARRFATAQDVPRVEGGGR